MLINSLNIENQQRESCEKLAMNFNFHVGHHMNHNMYMTYVKDLCAMYGYTA